MKVLLASDKEETTGILKQVLAKNRILIDEIHTEAELIEAGLEIQYDVLILDITICKRRVEKVVTHIRECRITTPILLLDERLVIENLVEGLEAGADDYLAKPFFTQEFVVRVKALSRRGDNYTESVLTFGNVRLNCNCYEMFNGTECLKLTNKEYQLLEIFLQHPHRVFSTERLLECVWGRDTDSNAEVVWTHIGFLRKKLRDLKADILIRTVRGAGYTLEEIVPK